MLFVIFDGIFSFKEQSEIPQGHETKDIEILE